MPNITRPIRFLLLWTALAAIVLVAANAALIVHWQANVTETICHHDCRDSHHESESEKSHDKEHCSICQILLGPAGKYITDTPITTLVLIGQTPSENISPTQTIQHHTLGTAEARGPPC